MTKKIYYPLALALTFSLFGCNEAPLEIEKVTPDNSEIHSSMMEEVKQDVPTIDEVISQIELQEDINDGIDVREFNEWFPVNNDLFAPEGSDWGEIYAKITDARAYRTFTEAGLSPEDCWEIFYNPQTDRIVNSPTTPEVLLIVAVDFTVENINATTENYHDPNYDDGYDEYDFRTDQIGRCAPEIYWTGMDGLFRGDECKDHILVFHLEPGETISFTVYYKIDPSDYYSNYEWFGWFRTSGTPELGYGVDLHFKDLIPEEWFEEALALNEQFSKSDDIDIVASGEYEW